MKEFPKITAVILNTNRRDDTLACLTSLYANHYSNLSAIVLDNASTDGSCDAIKLKFPQTQIINLKENLGYAGNNNVGIQAALEQKADWVFVMNEDIILAKDTLVNLIAAVHDLPKVGIVGPLVYHFDEPNVIQSAGGVISKDRWDSVHRGMNESDQGQYKQREFVDWISGCAIMVRADAIIQAGMIDTRFFYYWEETEWCVRIKRYGWQILFTPQAKIWHKGVQRNYQPNPNVTYYATRNKLLLIHKHKAPFGVWVRTISYFLKTLFSWTLKPKWRNKKEHRNALFQGMKDFLFQRWGMRSQSPHMKA